MEFSSKNDLKHQNHSNLNEVDASRVDPSQKKIQSNYLEEDHLKLFSNKYNENAEPNEKQDSIIPPFSLRASQQVPQKISLNQTDTNDYFNQNFNNSDSYDCSDEYNEKVNIISNQIQNDN